MAKILGDDRMAFGRRMGDEAIDLRRDNGFGEKGEGLRLIIAALALQDRPIDRRAVEAGRGSGLEPPELQTHLLQPFSESDGWTFPHSSRWKGLADRYE